MILGAHAINHEVTTTIYCLHSVGGEREERHREHDNTKELHFDDTVYSNYMVSIFIKLISYLFRYSTLFNEERLQSDP